MAAYCADNGPRRAQPTGAPHFLVIGIPFSGLLRREFQQPVVARTLSVSGVLSLCGLMLLTCLRPAVIHARKDWNSVYNPSNFTS